MKNTIASETLNWAAFIAALDFLWYLAKWIAVFMLLALAAGYIVGLHRENTAALAQAAEAGKDRDMLLACLNGQGALVSDTGAKVETITCRTKTTTTVRKVVAVSEPSEGGV